MDAHEKNKDAPVEKNLEIETKKNRVNIDKEIIPSKGKNNSRINQQNDKEKVTKIDTDDLTQESSVEEWGDLKNSPFQMKVLWKQIMIFQWMIFKLWMKLKPTIQKKMS